MCDVDGREGLVRILASGDAAIVSRCILTRSKKCLEPVSVRKAFSKRRVPKRNTGLGARAKDNCFCTCRPKRYRGACLTEGQCGNHGLS